MIRSACMADCAEIYRLICRLERRELPLVGFQQAYRSYMKRHNVFCLVFSEGLELLGCITMRIEYQLHHAAQIAEILELMVDETAMSRGVGGQLLDTALTLATSLGCQQIDVSSNWLRQQLQTFYEHAGFRNFHVKLTKKLTSETPEQNYIGV